MVTGLYAGIFALGAVLLIYQVVRLRYKHQVSLGDGGVEALQRMVRIHGNYIETVPMALILMFILESGGLSFLIVHLMGVIMILARASHYFGVKLGKGYGRWRVAGMALTFLVYISGAALCFWMYFRAHSFAL